jgi:TRAP-type C4-dicarboxylate transport system permease small subunit
MKLFKKVADTFGGLIFLCLFVTFLVQIAARFGFNRPLPWTDELAVILYIWAILWASAFMVPEKEQVVFDLLWNSASKATRRWMRIVGNAMIGGLALVAIPASWDYVHFMARESSPVLDISFQWVFLPFVLLLIALVLKSAWGIYGAIIGQGLDEQGISV